MKRYLLLTLLALSVAASCSRNGEYTYMRGLQLIESRDSLLPKLQSRLRFSAFRKNYDQTLVDRIGSSFRNFKHIRAYQRVLEDALVYLMIQTDTETLSDDLRPHLIRPVASLILGSRTGESFMVGLNEIAEIMRTNQGDARNAALDAFDAKVKAEDAPR
jgi:hypothetical protein